MTLIDKLERTTTAMTANKVAELLALHPLTVYRLAKSGRIPCFRVAGVVRFDPHAIADYLRTHEVRQ